MAARIFVTDGAGFIGGAVFRHLIGETDAAVLNIDKLTYAASPDALTSVASNRRYEFPQADSCDRQTMADAFRQGFIDAAQLERLAGPLKHNGYGQYLLQLLRDREHTA